VYCGWGQHPPRMSNAIATGVVFRKKCLAKKMFTHQDCCGVQNSRSDLDPPIPLKPITNRRQQSGIYCWYHCPSCGRLTPSSPHMSPKKFIKLVLPNETALHGLSISYNHNEGCIMVRVVGFYIITDLFI